MNSIWQLSILPSSRENSRTCKTAANDRPNYVSTLQISTRRDAYPMNSVVGNEAPTLQFQHRQTATTTSCNNSTRFQGNRPVLRRSGAGGARVLRVSLSLSSPKTRSFVRLFIRALIPMKQNSMRDDGQWLTLAAHRYRKIHSKGNFCFVDAVQQISGRS
jgi:hypothetical protein